MVKLDRHFSAVSSRFKSIAAAATSRLRAVATDPRLRAVATDVSTRTKAFSGPHIKAFNAAPPKVKVLVAGGALALMTGLATPAVAATQTAPAPSAQDVAVAAVEGTTPAAVQNGVTKYSAPAAPAPVAPTIDQLHPTGIQGGQTGFTPTTDQMRNAQKIIQAGQAMGLPPRAWVIAVATSLQETTLNNYGDLGGNNDHDSLGLFQQRPSSGWGAPAQLENPTYASEAFYKALTQVPNWDKMNLTDAAQAVQVSAFPDHYAKWEAHAGDIVDAFYGQGPLAQIANKVM